MKLADSGDKYEARPGQLLLSSAARGWPDMFAEFRSHGSGHADSFVQPATEMSVVFRGEGLVRRRGSGMTYTTLARPGVIWLCPAGEEIDWLEMDYGTLEILHLYLRPGALLDYAIQRGFEGAATYSLHYTGGVSDPLLEQIGRAILAEMHTETAGGSLLVESLCGSLSARLLQSHSTTALDVTARSPRAGRLDSRRLSRVLEYIHAHLGDELDVHGMACIANLSRFHFARAFKASTGQSPYQYVSAKRLAQAKVLLARNQPLADIALALRFSSQANFTRAFRREFGISPGRYREQASG